MRLFVKYVGIVMKWGTFLSTLGFVLAILLRRLDPPPPEKKYDWEGEDDGALTGNAWPDDMDTDAKPFGDN